MVRAPQPLIHLWECMTRSALWQVSRIRVWYSTRKVLSCSKKSSTSYRMEREHFLPTQQEHGGTNTHFLAAHGRPNQWLPSHSQSLVTLSPDMPVMRTSSADLTMLLRNPPKTSFLFFSRTLS